MRNRIAVLACAATWLCLSPAVAQEAPLRDPTETAGAPPPPPDAEAPAPSAQSAMPRLALRALVVVRGRAPAALVDAGGELIRVAAGESILVGEPPVAADIVSVEADGVRVAFPGRGRTVVLR
ncbi:MAG: hypothetical protein HMLKMBBP_03399 [Planctomycetes bacterium]|nr:hypothetical protein [Planctomycetota bacterium]